jgi:lysophospholipase L1-like esterase
VVGVPSRPALGERYAEFNRIVASLVSARGATFVPAPPSDGDERDGFVITSLRWDATIYATLARDLGAAIGLETAPGRPVSALADPGDGFVDKMARKGVQLFEALPAPHGRVVLFGDSITAGGFWEAWLPDLLVANRGIGGDTVAQLSARLDSAIDSPRAVSLLAGTNDLLRGNDPKDPESIAQRFRSLVAGIRQRDAGVPILINSVMPRAAKYSGTILAINERYRAIATEFDAQYLDLWPTMATPNNTLRKELTPDGLHLNAEGYRAWVGVLRPALGRLLDEK